MCVCDLRGLQGPCCKLQAYCEGVGSRNLKYRKPVCVCIENLIEKRMASSSSSSSSSTTSTTGRRGIPAAQFVEDVETYLTQSGLDVSSALSFLQERLQQYKLVEMKLLAQQRDLQAKIPDIEKCLDMVATLQAKKGGGEPLIADFEVSEGIYSRARVEEAEAVCLWLGANVMLEYSCEEVTIARVYNWDVHQRKMQQAATSAKDS